MHAERRKCEHTGILCASTEWLKGHATTGQRPFRNLREEGFKISIIRFQDTVREIKNIYVIRIFFSFFDPFLSCLPSYSKSFLFNSPPGANGDCLGVVLEGALALVPSMAPAKPPEEGTVLAGGGGGRRAAKALHGALPGRPHHGAGGVGGRVGGGEAVLAGHAALRRVFIYLTLKVLLMLKEDEGLETC